MTWLPRYIDREQQRGFLETGTLSSLRFSEFLEEKNVLFFPKETSKIEVAEALVRSMPDLDASEVLGEIWRREQEGALLIPPEVSLLRARVKGLIHVRLAAGVCPNGFADPSHSGWASRVMVILVAPADRLCIHLRFLVEISSLFRDTELIKTLLRLRSPRQVIRALSEAESAARGPRGLRQSWSRFLAGLFHSRTLF